MILSIENIFDEFQLCRLESNQIDTTSVSSLNSYIEEMTYNVNTYITEANNCLNNFVPFNSPSITPYATTYNRTGAVNYAFTYALTPNPAYYDFSSSGGDCTNFVSQCLYAGGGIPMHNNGVNYDTNSWFYVNGSTYSSCWTKALYFNKYITSSNGKINASLTDYYGCSVGDVIQLFSGSNAYHSVIITAFDNPSGGTDRGDIYVCCHTSNRRNANFFTTWSGSSYKMYKIYGGR